MRRALGLATAAALMVGSTTAFAQQPQQATAELRDSNGQTVGTATFMPMGGGVHVMAQVRNLPPGPHGIHIHAVGTCDAPDFMTAGPHFNPTSTMHGLQNPGGPHAGDMPNLEVGADGTATFDYQAMMVSLGAGEGNLFDADGSALVIHANADDHVTDPSGNSGGRIACGVVARAGAPVAQPSPAAKPAGAPAAAPTAAPAAKPAGAPAQTGAPAAKPSGAPAQVAAPAAPKPAGAPAAAPAQAPRPMASPMPAGLPRTGSATSLVGVAVPAALAGLTALGLGLALRRRR